MIDRIMPQSSESELAVLGSIMLDPRDALEIALGLSVDHFWHKHHALTFTAISELHRLGNPIDTVSLTNHLRDSGNLEFVGGAYFVSQLTRVVPSSSNVGYYVDVIREKQRLRNLIVLAGKIEKEAYEAEDSKDLLSDVESQIYAMGAENQTSENQLQEACLEIERQIELRKQGIKISGLSSGIPSFDQIFFGFQKGQYYVLGGRPSSGKSAFADQVCGNVLERGESVIYISLESSKERVVGKLAAKRAQVVYSDFIKGYLNPEDLERFSKANAFFKKSNLILHKPYDLTGASIRSLMRKEKRKNNIGLMIFDYLQLIGIPNGMDERRAIGDCSKQIQRACIETGVPALVLAQLNRDSEKEARPKMRHLKETSQIEQDADNIILLWSDKEPNEVPLTEYLPVTCSIEKNKDGPSGIDQELFFDRKLMTFRETQKHNYENHTRRV